MMNFHLDEWGILVFLDILIQMMKPKPLFQFWYKINIVLKWWNEKKIPWFPIVQKFLPQYFTILKKLLYSKLFHIIQKRTVVFWIAFCPWSYNIAYCFLFNFYLHMDEHSHSIWFLFFRFFLILPISACSNFIWFNTQYQTSSIFTFFIYFRFQLFHFTLKRNKKYLFLHAYFLYLQYHLNFMLSKQN